MKAVGTCIQFKADLISDDGKVRVESTETFLGHYLSELRVCIQRANGLSAFNPTGFTGAAPRPRALLCQ